MRAGAGIRTGIGSCPVPAAIPGGDRGSRHCSAHREVSLVEDLFRAARRGALNADTATVTSDPVGSIRAWMALPGDAESSADTPAASWPVRDPDEARLAQPSTIDTASAETGWRRGIRRLTGGLISPKPSAAERRLRAARAVAGSSLDRPLTVLVTPVGAADAAMCLADAFARLRGGSVVALASGAPSDTVHDLAEVLDVLRRSYRVICLDDPAAVDLADVLVVRRAATREAADAAQELLSRLRASGHGELADRAVISVPAKETSAAWTFVCASIIDSFVAADSNQETTQ